MFAEAFAGIAEAFSEMTGAPFHDARIITQSELEYDDGGSIIPGSGEVVERDCRAQVDVATEAMRLADGFTDEDRRILVLSASLTGGITTDDQIEFLDGPFEGIWNIESVTRDPAGIGWELRGRRG